MELNFNQRAAANLRAARMAQGLQQKEMILQKSLGVTQATYSRWESGRVNIPAAVLVQLGIMKWAI